MLSVFLMAMIKKKYNLRLSLLLFMGFSVFSTLSCKKKDEHPDIIYFNPNITYSYLMDQQGNIYKTLTIGTQIWMAENLKTTIYRNGDSIPNIMDSLWDYLDTGAYCNYNNDIHLNNKGRLYNWYAVNDSRYLAPEGWHIPSDSEWTVLINYLGEDNAGGKMKEAGFAHWYSPNAGADNSSGFSAIPAGARYEQGFFFGAGAGTSYWSATEADSFEAWHYSLSSNYEKVGRYFSNKTFGISVRCVKD
jgi:uncharacterized protein (TIGR02145 family)